MKRLSYAVDGGYTFSTALGILLVATLCAYAGERKTDPDHDPIDRALAAADREPGDLTLDAERRTAELLKMIRVQPGMHVADLFAGRGYYTELTSRIVGPNGRVYAVNPESLSNTTFKAKTVGSALQERLDRYAATNISPLKLPRQKFELLDGVPDSSVDIAISALHYHELVAMDANRFQFTRSIYRILKPKGILVVIEAASKAGQHPRDSYKKGRFAQDYLAFDVNKSGLDYAGFSDLLVHYHADQHDWNADEFSCETRCKEADRYVVIYRKPEETVIGWPVQELSEATRGTIGSTYERIGGIRPLTLLVVNMFERLQVNPKVQGDADFVAGLIDRSPAFQVSMILAKETGGPHPYFPRRSPVDIADQTWDAVVFEMDRALRFFNLPADESQDIQEVFERNRRQIAGEIYAVTRPEPAMDQTKGTPGSLYERIGGLGPLANFMYDFSKRNSWDPVQWQNPLFKKHKDYLPFEVGLVLGTLLGSQVLGGPYPYLGRSLPASHKHMNFTEEEWLSFVRTVQTSVNLSGWPRVEAVEFMGIIRSTRGDVIGDEHVK